jgi:REP element-mobilizing transposase RayT
MPAKTNVLPYAYFITFTTYGTWLQGDFQGWVDREHNEFGTERLKHDPLFNAIQRNALKHEPITLTSPMIKAVRSAVLEVCEHRRWPIVRGNVRTNHVHLLVCAAAKAEKVLGDFKRYATRRLRADKLLAPDRPVWTDGGSTIYVWTKESAGQIERYIARRQGDNLGGLI